MPKIHLYWSRHLSACFPFSLSKQLRIYVQRNVFLLFSSRRGSLNLLLIATYRISYLYIHSVTLTFIICLGGIKNLNRKHKWGRISNKEQNQLQQSIPHPPYRNKCVVKLFKARSRKVGLK